VARLVQNTEAKAELAAKTRKRPEKKELRCNSPRCSQAQEEIFMLSRQRERGDSAFFKPATFNLTTCNHP
jgi:hypothetical protein